jgi:Secretion system C-terminal sorting domain
MELNRMFSCVLSPGVALLLALLIATITPTTLRAQELFVEASTPVIGDSSVAQETTVRFQFSAPLDTTARFSNGWPVAFFAIEPADSIRIDSMYFSGDLRELVFDVTQTDDTEFIWLLTGAVALEGFPFCQAVALRYTTAETWPSFSVRGVLGTVSPVGPGKTCDKVRDNVQAYIAGLMTGDPRNPESRLVTASAVAELSVSFVMPVRDGTYWPVGFIDDDGNGEIQPNWSLWPSHAAEATYYLDYIGGEGPDSVVVNMADVSELLMSFPGAGSREQPVEIPGFVHGFRAYPNPTAGALRVAYHVEAGVDVAVSVFDLLGREVRVLVEESVHAPGPHEMAWHFEDVASGIYFVRLQAAGRQITRPILILR